MENIDSPYVGRLDWETNLFQSGPKVVGIKEKAYHFRTNARNYFWKEDCPDGLILRRSIEAQEAYEDYESGNGEFNNLIIND